MNSPERPQTADAPLLAGLAFALLAPAQGEESAEAKWLCGWRSQLPGADPAAAGDLWRLWAAAPPPGDRHLHALGGHLRLGLAELIAVALAAAAELDLLAGRALAWLQAPTGGARPTAGLVASLARTLDGGDIAPHLAKLAAGAARNTGLLQLEGDNRPLPETGLRVPQAIALALAGIRSHGPGLALDREGEREPPLPPSLREAAGRYARALASGSAAEPAAMAIRCGHPKEARAVAQTIARALRTEAAFLEGDAAPGLGPWLWLNGRIPVLCAELAPGEKRVVPNLPGYGGPVLIAAGPDGGFEWQGAPVTNWRVPVPAAAERVALWQVATGDGPLAQQLGTTFRHASGRIHDLAAAGRFQSALAGEAMPDAHTIAAAARCGAAADLGTLAELLPETIGDSALVLPPQLRTDLESLVLRCSGRDTLAEGLGPATLARHRPGVRALFHGPSGTGKSLAVGWLATRLGLPLYRIDLASVTSKYIGETEKNLAQLFARAEHAEVVLMFDEADALFGKRTEVKDANDRYANAQTNYLLQRIETFEGIAILTSNSRARFDSAFTRRLDAIIEFPLPAPEERRDLWLAHLGQAHGLSVANLNRLAAACDLAGGHIRNVVLAAAITARAAGGPIEFGHLASAIADEYRKLGRQAPAELQRGG